MKIETLNPHTITENNAVTRIIIYGNGEKLYTTGQGYFEESQISKNGKISTTYDGRPERVILSSEPKQARKENLNRTDNYYLKYSGGYNSWENGIALYIHESEIQVQPAGEYIQFETHGETNYTNAVKLTFTHGAIMRRCKIERVPEAGPDFTPPEGCRWSKDYSRDPLKPNYDTIRARPFGKNPGPVEVVKRWIETETASGFLVMCPGYSKTEKTPERLHREKLAKIMNENRVFSRDVSHYDIENLLKIFDIKIKENAVQL